MIVTTEHGDRVNIDGFAVVQLIHETLIELDSAKDRAYSERNAVVAALAHMARAAGWPVSRAEHEGPWEDDWRAILVIESPEGQLTWHFHDTERELLAPFDVLSYLWDGHSTEEKYDRLSRATEAFR